MKNLLLVLLLFFTVYAQADPEVEHFDFEQPNQNQENFCDTLENLAPLKQDLPTEKDRQNLKNCDAVSLYYGYNGKPDLVQARLCALSNLDNDNFESDILFLLYAKGEGGLKQDYSLSMHFACKASSAPAEVDSRIAHLKKLQKKKVTNPNIDICDDITSGFMEGWCAEKDDKLLELKRQNRVQGLKDTLNDNQKKAFEELTKSYFEFCQVHSDNEVDKSGTGRAAFMIQERADCQEQYLNHMEDFAKGKFFNYAPEDYIKIDSDLNFIYKKTLKELAKISVGVEGELNPTDIKNTERTWLKNQDLWIDDFLQIYPQINKNDLQAFLEQQRTEQLKNILGS